MITSGVRLGSPVGTTRGFGTAEFREIGLMIGEIVNGIMKNGEAGDGQVEARVKEQATALCRRFPIYG
jgi:glycine hydroxymethyltransferase